MALITQKCPYAARTEPYSRKTKSPAASTTNYLNLMDSQEIFSDLIKKLLGSIWMVG
jgi:hypothetical protein